MKDWCSNFSFGKCMVSGETTPSLAEKKEKGFIGDFDEGLFPSQVFLQESDVETIKVCTARSCRTAQSKCDHYQIIKTLSFLRLDL